MLTLITEAALAAGAEALRILPDATLVNDKGRGDFATAADIGAQEVALKVLSQGAPGIEFVAEESIAPESIPKTCFTVDPFDGTIIGSRGAKEWGVLISYVENGEAQAGVMYQPELGVLVKAERGKGCQIRKGPNEDFQVVDFRKSKPRASQELAVSFDLNYTATAEHIEYFLTPLIKTRRLLVARNLCAAIANTIELLTGTVDVYMNPSGGKIWDYAPCALAVQESGGTAHIVSLNPPGHVTFSCDRLAMPVMFCRNAEIADEIFKIWEEKQF